MSILIDAIYVHVGGGKTLLDFLIKEIVNNAKKLDQVFFLLDERYKLAPQYENVIQVEKIAPTLRARERYYRKSKDKYDTILALGNVPTIKNTKGTVYTYFHQLLYVDKIPLKLKNIKLLLKTFFIKNFKSTVDFWLVQNNKMGSNLAETFSIPKDEILVFPFYPTIEASPVVKKEQYIYPSLGYEHKNHRLLINSFVEFYDKHQRGKLLLTVSDENTDLKDFISSKAKAGYPIENLGFIDRDKLIDYYAESAFVIFPSLKESFGLGLVEGIESGCKIISSDLPYVYEVCQPSITFDPHKQDSIVNALEKSLSNDVPNSESIVQNNINNLLQMLKIKN